MVKFLSYGLIIIGSMGLLFGLSNIRRILREANYRGFSWYALLFLVIGFIGGYVAFAVYLWSQQVNTILLTIALVFAGGGVFVALITLLSVKTIREVKYTAELKLETAKIRAIKKRLETILDNAAEGIIVFDESGLIMSVNHTAEYLFGYRENEVLGKAISLLMPPEKDNKCMHDIDFFVGNSIKHGRGNEKEVIGCHRDGTRIPLALKVSAMEIDNARMYTGLIADISERKTLMENLKRMAEHDSITGLYNRSYFQTELDRVVARVMRGNNPSCALFYVDMDNFKYINDTLGHEAGDRLLCEISRLFKQRTRKSDLLARFGGDEFTMIIFNVSSDIALAIAESYRQQLVEYVFRQNGCQMDVACSIGVAMIDQECKSSRDLLSRADFSCHQAKLTGRNRVRMFNLEDMDSVNIMTHDMGWSRRIKKAIGESRFVLVYQPIVNVKSRNVDCYEVLIRMLGDSNELIMPNGFLPAAERFGLAVEIDKWVITNAINILAEKRKHNCNIRFAINLSGYTLPDLQVCHLIQQHLQHTGLDPSAITFEVTETVAISDISSAEVFLSKLRELGCMTALDDFGSGMSSFAYLHDLPVDIVKIDGRFVKNLADNRIDQAMVKAMNDIAHALGKKTVAEFVENEESFRLLDTYGVDAGQGYHLGRPEVELPDETANFHQIKRVGK